MKFNRLIIIKLVIAAVIVSALLANVRTLSKEINHIRKGKVDGAVHYENIFEPIKGILPAKADIGYITDENGGPEFAQALYLTQYALSPRHIKVNEIYDFILVKFNDTTKFSHYNQNNQFELVKVIDDNIRLYKRITK